MKFNFVTICKEDHKRALLNGAYIVFTVALLCRFLGQLFKTYGYKSWSMSEFLINYQGGFVRRGLTGEILFFFAKNFNINVEWTIKIFCLICFSAVIAFFIRAFLKRGYSLYVLSMCFFLGGAFMTGCWIRKDYFLLCNFILIFWLFNKNDLSLFVKFVFINILALITLLTHEVFGFFTFPILYILYFNQLKGSGRVKAMFKSFVFLLPVILTFLLVILKSGNSEIAQAIGNSWTKILNLSPSKWTSDTSILELDMADIKHLNSVGAIAWTVKEAFIHHFKYNFLSFDNGVSSLLVWGVTFPIVYFIATNVLLVFRKNETDYTIQHKRVLSSILIFQLLCLSPLFLALSCDYLRIFSYWIISSYAIFLLVDFGKLEQWIPSILLRMADKVNRCLERILTPSKTLISLLMMFIGISGSFCIIEWTYCNSMIYNILFILTKPITRLWGPLSLFS